MAFKIIIIIFLSSVFTACSDLGADDGRSRPDNNRRTGPHATILSSSVCIELQEENEGDESLSLEDIETTSFFGQLQNCRTGMSTPDNTLDLFVNAIGLQNKYAPGRFRDCLRCKLAEAHNKICSSRDELERQKQDANSDSERFRIENSIARLDELQLNFNQRLHTESNKWNDRANKYADKDSSGLGRAVNWFGQQESEALRDILNEESYNECNSFYHDDADDYRYEDDYGRNKSYARRRSSY